MQTIGTEVIATQTIIESSFNGQRDWVHALPGERGRIVAIDEKGATSVQFDRSGTTTVVDRREVTATRHVVPTWYTVAEARALLKLSKTTFYERVKAGLICTVRDGGRVFVSGEELARYRS